MSMLPQLLNSGGGMKEVQEFMMSKLMESMMDKVEDAVDGKQPSGVEAIVSQLAPLFGGGDSSDIDGGAA